MLEGMYQAQVVWDEAMADAALRFLESPAGAGRQLVIVAGSGHVLHHLGINLRLARRAPSLSQATLVCLGVPASGEPVSRGLADVVAGTSPEGKAVEYPTLGLGLPRQAGAAPKIERLAPHGAVAGVDLKVGDLILAVDGEPAPDVFSVRWLLGQRDWGQRVTLRLRRGGEELTRTLTLAR